MFKIRRDTHKFTGRSHSVRGMISLAMGGVSALCLTVLFILSGVHDGKGSLIFGVAGLFLLALSVAGFLLGMKACEEQDIYYTAPVTGMVISGVLSIILFILYVTGLFA